MKPLKDKRFSSQPKTQKTTFYWVTCACVSHPQKLTDQKSPKSHQRLCGNSTFTDPLSQLENTQPLHGSIKAMDKELLAEAERIASDEFGVKKLLVISALGTRRYYMRLGYGRDGVYVSKRLNTQ